MIGDSVSLGMKQQVFDMLKDQLESYHSPGNADNANVGAHSVRSWLETSPPGTKWDVRSTVAIQHPPFVLPAHVSSFRNCVLSPTGHHIPVWATRLSPGPRAPDRPRLQPLAPQYHTHAEGACSGRKAAFRHHHARPDKRYRPSVEPSQPSKI